MQNVPKTLYTEIAKNAVLDNTQSEFVTASTGIDFGEVSSDTNGKGIYTFSSTKDEKFPVHYYRGAVTDNNVKFGGFCWKIVRTTETGGVKLIYNGSPDASGKCTNTIGESTQIGTSAFNETNNSLESVGYMVGNTSDSTIKGTIDTWYRDNMTSYTEKLEDTIWCNDRSVSKTENSNTYFGANERVFVRKKPSLECVNELDKFTVDSNNGNGLLTYPVALLTADESILAGGINKDNSSYYLYTYQDSWTLSPCNFENQNASNLFIGSYGNLHALSVSNTYSVRPSISLAPNTKIKTGNGTSTNPFIVE